MARTIKPTGVLEAALAIAALGVPVHPLHPNKKTPAWTKWQTKATTDPDTIRAAFANGANVGIAWPQLTLDCDDPARVLELEATYPELATAPAVDTPRGGRHWYLRSDEWRIPTRAKAAPGLDIRGFGRAYTVGPASRIDDTTYTLVRPFTAPHDAPQATDALRAYLSPKPKPATPPRPPQRPTAPANAQPWAAAALNGEADRVRAAATGTRNHTLNAAAFALGQLVPGGYLDEANATDHLLAAAIAAGLELDEARTTIRSGLTAGNREPRHPPERTPAPRGAAPRDPSDPGPTEDDGAELNHQPPREATNNTPLEAPPRRVPILVRLSSVQPEAVDHLDDGRLALGKLTLLVGDAGAGKTHIALALAANITTGRPLFPVQLSHGSRYREPANVLALIGEDGLADTIRPRFDKAGGDASRFMSLPGYTTTADDGTEREHEVDLTQVDVLDDAMTQLRPALVIVDPVQVYLGPNADMNKATEVRAALKGVARLAEKHHAALLILGHLNKGNGSGKAIYRALGSIDFVAIARSVLLVSEHNGARVLAHAKANLSATAPTLEYTLNNGELSWTGVSKITANELTTAPATPQQAPARAAAVEWLQAALDNGPMRVDALQAAAERDQVASWRTINAAKAGAGVESRLRYDDDGARYWEWFLE